jgi:putative membrane protein
MERLSNPCSKKQIRIKAEHMSNPLEPHSTRIFLTGFIMGMADLVPGISGGTVALLGGIYARLLGAISAFNLSSLKMLLTGRWLQLWQQVDGRFLLTLLLGIASAIFGVAKILHYLLDHYPIIMWSLFLGLVFTAGIMLLRTLYKEQCLVFGYVLLGFLISGLLAQLPMHSGWDVVSGWGYLALFAAGAIAICAMILPGVSGSFILLLLGFYPLIIASLASINIPVLAVFALGCVIGLMSFSRLLNWLLRHYLGATMSALTGLMLGSAIKLWPWKYTLAYRLSSSGEQVPLVQENLWPWNYSALTGIAHELPIALIVMLIAAVLVIRFGQFKLQGLGQ